MKQLKLKAASSRDIFVSDKFPQDMCEEICSICNAIYYISPGVWAAHKEHGSFVCGVCALDVWDEFLNLKEKEKCTQN